MHILLIDDDPTVTQTLGNILKKQKHQLTHAPTGAEGLQRLESASFDLILTDLQLPDYDGLNLVKKAVSEFPQIPVVLITGFGSNETAIRAMQLGAYDYITKPFDIEELLECINKVAHQLSLETVDTSSIHTHTAGSVQLIGKSKLTQNLSKEIGRVAPTNVTVLITGETGTGKEVVARLIQAYSPRKDAPFVAVNCSAFPENLIESELFGYEKGAFTGAHGQRIGRIEQANGGTLFLDEIGELDANAQVKLLRFLQEKTIQRIGGNSTIELDVRVISATNMNMVEAVRNGTFREDLFYRLNVAHIAIPSLRQRSEDIPELFGYFNQKYAREFNCKPVFLSEEAQNALCEAPWPGNIRQLENSARQLLIKSNSRHRSHEDVREVLASGISSRHVQTQEMDEAILAKMLFQKLCEKYHEDLNTHMHEAVDKALICESIRLTGGHQTRAAKLLGVSMKTLRDKLKKYNAHPKSN